MSATTQAQEAEDARRRREQEQRLRAVWESPKGWRYWSDVNNSSVGLWYTITCFAFMLFAGVLALLMRLQLAVPDNDLLSARLYNQAFTSHGSVMMFLFAVPLFEAFSILLLPQMLAARDLPFPRLSAYGYWSFLIGGVFVCGSIFFDAAPMGGWFMYPPLTIRVEGGLGTDIWLLGLSFIEVASIAAAVELIVGTLKCRPPGMSINLIPLYAWYILVVAAMILFAFPPLIAGDLLMELESAFDWPFFDASRGGDPLLWQHLFWIFGHPEVYIIFLPAIALIAMIVPTFAQRAMVGYSWIVLAAIGTGFLSFGLWVHHMFTTGLPSISLGFFSAASEAVAIPTGVQIFVFIATLLAGKARFGVPMLFATGSLGVFILGGLTGVMVALAPFDWQAHDSYFIVAHLHFVLVGGVLLPVFGGLYYFYPLCAAKRLSERLGRTAFWLMFAGFMLAFMPMHFTGLRGMPRRVFTYPAGLGWDTLNLVSTAGAFLFAIGVLLVVLDVLRPKSRRPISARNPWNAGTLEWLATMPSEDWGVRSVPQIHTRYPLWEQPDLMRLVDRGECYLPDAEEGRRETMVTTVLEAEPVQCLRVPGPTWITLWAALFTGGAFIFSVFHWWIATTCSAVLTAATIIAWLWTGTAWIPEKRSKPAGLGLTLRLYQSGSGSVGWWAMFITMIGDMTAFASLVFGYFFYWTARPDFVPQAAGTAALPWLLLCLAGGLAAWLLTFLARNMNARGHAHWLKLLLAIAALLAAGSAAALVAGPAAEQLDPTAHVYPATVWVLVLWTGVHTALGLVMILYCLAGSMAGRLTPEHDIDIRNVALFWHFLAAMLTVTVAVIGLFPLIE